MNLIMIACLAANMAECKEVVVQVDTNSQHQCFMQSVHVIAAWQQQNPKYVIKKWTCTTEIYKDI